MVIFLFISLSYMGLLQYQKRQQDKIFEEYRQTRAVLYMELQDAYRDDFMKWDLEIDRDLSIRFNNPEVLFAPGSSQLTTKFKETLNDFLPKYLSIIAQDKYEDQISEIRIEGHTDTLPLGVSSDSYIDNVQLSQERAREVMRYFRGHKSYGALNVMSKKRLQFWLTANGLSYGRALDENKHYAYLSERPIDKAKSRRVEFRIITSSEALVDEVIKRMK
jgi:outer membrane protein OmpA-like peptidoglycan-associated protein